jgi:serine/threonine protein kinase
MAPEQVKGWMLSPSCDIYAVGLILWEALTGCRAYTGHPYSIMEAKAAQATGLRLECMPPGVSPTVGELVERCTHPHPSHRPTADEAVELLEQCLSPAPNQSLQQTLVPGSSQLM